jgi:hypothetical protein
MKNISILGIGLTCFFSTIGFFLATFNFFSPMSNISHTGGAELVIITTLSITCLSVLVFFFRHFSARWERVSLYIILIAIMIGTLFATVMLESWALLIILIFASIGLFIQIVTR